MHKLGLSVPIYTTTAAREATGTLNTLEEQVEAHEINQLQRLGCTEEGRSILTKLG